MCGIASFIGKTRWIARVADVNILWTLEAYR